MTVTGLWEQLVSSALMGTERRAFSPAGDYGINRPDSELALLDMAAILSLQHRAGWQPATYHGALPDGCEPDEMPRCSPRAASHLMTIINGENKALLPEWLEAAGRNDWRVPEECLPALLTLGRKDTSIRAAVVRVIGRRGYWLADQNSVWAYAAGGEVEDWEEASHPARAIYLRFLRETDAAQGRELLEGCWESEPAKHRADLLAYLEVGLSMEDEPFLEAALDDRSKLVCAAAADLLVRLPGSRLVARMQERVDPLVHFGKKGFEIELPAAVDEAMQRDGITEKPSSSLRNIGKKAWWLMAMLQTIPPSWWSERFEANPVDLVRAAGKCEWKDVLHEGWIAALMRHPDLEWAAALLAIYPTRMELLAGLLSEQREQCVMEIFHAEEMAKDLTLLQLIDACKHPWSVPFAEFVMDQVVDYVQDKKRIDHRADGLISTFGLRIPPNMALEVRARLLESEKMRASAFYRTLKQIVTVLEFRQRMLKELEQ